MKRLIKFPLKLAWRALGPIRRPLVREFEGWLDRYVVMTSHAATEEANIGFDFAAAELARMQQQVEAMRAVVEGQRREGLVVVGGS
jgi:hypothetical protein